MFTTTTWLTGSKPAFGMSAPACIQGTAVSAARLRHIDALDITGATSGTSAWSPPDW
ncbi:hypothetical protein J2S59_003920 [Nocardioides massiliensis]|uniref:Uncharacterized protein n=1 Tax=Nocardioides massiliensis TaxID=1325935 RepID=A0ABT9NUJ9_9ACTN|nr:hypothetical protein [Nocardioides massiliensis]